MPTPKPITDPPVTNADGSVTTTVREFHSNGSIKKVKKTTVDAAGETTVESAEEYGRGPAADPPAQQPQGTKKKSKTSKYAPPAPGEKYVEVERTEIKFDKNGNATNTRKQTFDPSRSGGDEVRRTEDVVTTGKGSRTTTTDWNRTPPPPRREVVTVVFCKGTTRPKVRVTQVFYRPERRWNEERREKKTERFDCRTGRPISFQFPERPPHLASATAATLAIALLAFAAATSHAPLLAAGTALAVLAALTWGFEIKQRAELTELLLSFAQSAAFDDLEDEESEAPAPESNENRQPS